MTKTHHQCEPEDICNGLVVALDTELLRSLCPQHSKRELGELVKRHAEPIADHMIAAGITAALHLINGNGGMS